MTDSDQTNGQNRDEAARPDAPARPEAEEMPDADDMEEPSAEKEVGEEPKAPSREEPEPSHEAVGIGIIGRPQVEPEDPSDEAREQLSENDRHLREGDEEAPEETVPET